MTDCNPHPDAPHGFDRTASLNEDRYVCDCESWSETNRADDSLRTRIAAVAEAHEPCGLPGGIDCNCGQGFRPDSGSWVERAVEARQLWSQHLADAVIRELEPELNRHNTGCVCDDCWGDEHD